MAEKRSSERKLISQLLQVTDRQREEVIGNLVNLSPAGLMLITSNPVAEDSLASLTLELPQAVDGRTRVDLEARCVWCRPSTSGDDYGAGFQIEQIAPEDDQALRQIFGSY